MAITEITNAVPQKQEAVSYMQIGGFPLTQPGGLGQLGTYPYPQTVIGGIPDATWKRLSNETRLAILKELGVIA